MLKGRTTMKQQTEAKDAFPRQIHAGGLWF
jgi:hypothetical protein